MANNTKSAQELYSLLFEACNIMRGPIDQDDYKSYITPLLFFKRISDVYDEEYRHTKNRKVQVLPLCSTMVTIISKENMDELSHKKLLLRKSLCQNCANRSDITQQDIK